MIIKSYQASIASDHKHNHVMRCLLILRCKVQNRGDTPYFRGGGGGGHLVPAYPFKGVIYGFVVGARKKNYAGVTPT